MHYARSVNTLFLLLSSAVLTAGAQEHHAVAFDPTPVRLPPLEKSQSRPVTSKDLLEIRDQKG